MISIELLATLATFAFVTSVTPGPNNIMLTASGANIGFVRTLPHIAGIVAGVALLNLCIGLGLGALFLQFPIMQDALKIVGSLYLIWLAIKLLGFSYAENRSDLEARPFSFIQALVFQAINPKAWVMVISANASSSLTGDAYWISVGFIILVFAIIGPPSVMIWAGFGQMIRQYLKQPSFLKTFNIVMASLTVGCVVFIWQG
jgi:threonine/homoserine/homoserine lactone efflux protein